MNVRTAMTPLEWVLLLLLSLMWGGSFFFVEVALRAFSPLTVVTLRVGIAALILQLLLPLLGLKFPCSWQHWRVFLTMAVLNNIVPFNLIAWGQVYIPGGLAAILNATTPFFAMLFAHFFTQDENLRVGKVVGFCVGFAGVIWMLAPEVQQGIDTAVFAQLACLLASCFYAMAGVYGRRFARMHLHPLQAATGQLSASTLVLLPLCLIVDQPWQYATPSLASWGAALGLALGSTVIAYAIYFRILASAGATNVLLVTMLIPVSAILLGVLLLHEVLLGHHVLGMGLISLGLLMIDGRMLPPFVRLFLRFLPGRPRG